MRAGPGLHPPWLTCGGQFYSVVELVEKDGSVSSLLRVFNDQSASDRIVQFLRLLTSAFIRNRADFFRHFVDEEMDIKDFCTHVGPRGLGLRGRGSHPGLCSSLCLGGSSTGIPAGARGQGSVFAVPRAQVSQPEAPCSSCLNCVALGRSRLSPSLRRPV